MDLKHDLKIVGQALFQKNLKLITYFKKTYIYKP